MWKRIIVMTATLLAIGVNWLANSLPLNGRNTGEVSGLYPTPFTPAGYVFSIWALIYTGLLAYSGWQLRLATRGSRRLDSIVHPYLLGAAANIGWIFCWHWLRIGGSMLAMLVLLGSLIVVYRRLRIEAPASRAERWAVDATFSVYLGWICVATLANLSVWLEAIGTRPFGLDAASWAATMILLATVVFAVVGLRTRDVVFLAVLVWAAIGIAIRGQQVALVAGLAWGAAAVAAGVGFIAANRRGRRAG